MADLPSPYSLPLDLHPLLPVGDGTGRTLPCALQSGRLVRSDQGTGEPAFWLSDHPVDDMSWSKLLAEHERTGFWPMMLISEDEDGGPWATGEVSFDNVTSPADHDPQALLREWWHRHVVPHPVDTAPFGDRWPDAPVRTPPLTPDPDEVAENFVGSLLYEVHDDDPHVRLGMIAGRSADAVTKIGWQGAAKHTNDVAKISTVLRVWERRYGARVYAIKGNEELYVSVAAPPSDREEALRLAAEHFAFCPNLLPWDIEEDTLASYADGLIDDQLRGLWIFSWE